MNKSKVLVLGYFGYVTNQLDGQTVKTRSIYELLKSKEKKTGFILSFFDTQTFQTNRSDVLKMFSKVCKTDILIYIAAHNNLKYFFPIIYLIAKVRRIPIHYIVVGGWLAEFIKNKPLHIHMLRKIKGIYPQTKDLKNKLQSKYNFKNVQQLYNFRMTENILQNKVSINPDNNKLRLVFMARVHPMKGVDVLFHLADELKSSNIHSVSIDIYGPIFDEYKQEFEEKMKVNELINYRGILQPADIQKTLSEYDVMLFPTKYFTEGFPGSILDSFYAGVPVISTKWKYADEFIDDGHCGIISPFDNESAFIENVKSLIENPKIINELKKGALKQALKFSPEVAWDVLEENMFTK
jgi:glycosyltransferase involved in cell wall biosynthesis